MCCCETFYVNEMIITVPEPEVHDHCGFLFLRPEEVFHANLPALYYLVRVRIIEFQDWNTPPSSPDDDGGGAKDDDDSGDNHYNGSHPSIDDAPSRSSHAPRMTRFANAGNGDGGGPAFGRGSGPIFRTGRSIMVGTIACPLHAVFEQRAPVRLLRAASPMGAPVDGDGPCAAEEVDLIVSTASLEVDVALGMSPDPMLMEASVQVAIPRLRPWSCLPSLSTQTPVVW